MFTYETIQTFNQTEISIYRYLTANAVKIPYMSIRELASELHVSTATILRFCHKAGMEGYNELKQLVLTSMDGMKQHELKQDLAELELYFQQVNTESFEKRISAVVDMVAAAKKIFFIGLGSSGALARYGARYFSNLGKFAIGLEDQLYPITEEMADNTVVIVLSVSGETPGLIEFVNRCRETGCKSLCITNSASSHLAGMADMNLTYNVAYQQGPEGHNATTQVPVIFLMEAIARRL